MLIPALPVPAAVLLLSASHFIFFIFSYVQETFWCPVSNSQFTILVKCTASLYFDKVQSASIVILLKNIFPTIVKQELTVYGVLIFYVSLPQGLFSHRLTAGGPKAFFGSGNFLSSALNKFPACSMFFISLHSVIINDALPLSFYDFFL